MISTLRAFLALSVLVVPALAQVTPSQTKLLDIYRDQSHCLTLPDMRGDGDKSISCYCRDAIVMARYVYRTYLLSAKDDNLNGIFLVLTDNVRETCGEDSASALNLAELKDWRWDAPEVVRTYPPDDAIKRIAPERKDGQSVGRWVPYTIQLVYQDDAGHVRRTENYSSRELEPIIGDSK